MEVPGRTKSKQNENCNLYLLCQPCQSEGNYISAEGFCETCNESFCSSCLTLHCRRSVTKKHLIILSKDVSSVETQNDMCSEFCEFHKGQRVDFYCQRHKCVCCGVCSVLNHSSCKVWQVQDISGNYSNSKEFNMIKKRIDQINQDIKSSKTEIQKSMKAAEEIKNKLIEEIKTFRHELNSYLDEVEDELVQQVERLYASDVSVQGKLNECEAMEKEMEDLLRKFDQCSDKTNTLFITAKRMQGRLQALQKSLDATATKSQMGNYKFEPSTHFLQLKQKQSPIGTVTKQLETNTGQSKACEMDTIRDFRMTDMLAQFVTKMNLQLPSEKDCCITGLAMVSVEEILLADTDNKSLKILNLTDGSITSMLRPPSQPYDVTSISAVLAAATIPDKGMILFVNIKDGLTLEYTLKVRNCCKGIDHHDGLLAVSFCGPPAVQILNMEGHILHEVHDRTRFQHPCNIAFSNDKNSVFVSDFARSVVYQLKIDGYLKVTNNYETTHRPSGLDVTKDGTVSICCMGDNEKVRMFLPQTRRKISLYTEDVKKPCSILVSEELMKMFICENRESHDCSFIKVFELKSNAD